MARINVDIPDSILGEEKAKELAQARKRIRTLEERVAKLEQTHQQAKEAVTSYRALRSVVAETLDLYEDYPWD